MKLLPIQTLREEDKHLVDDWLFKFSNLKKHNFPFSDGLVVFPPDIKESMRKFNPYDLESFLKVLAPLKNTLKGNLPPEFVRELKVVDRNLNIKLVWERLIEKWLDQLKNIIEKKGFNVEHIKFLKALPLLFCGKIEAYGTIRVTKNKEPNAPYFYDSIINVAKGTLEPKYLKELEELVVKMEKFLGINFKYHFVLEKKDRKFYIKFTNLSLPTYHEDVENGTNQLLSLSTSDPGLKVLYPKKVTKVFIDVDSFMDKMESDGAIICSEKINDKEEKLKILLNTCEKLHDKQSFSLSKPVIFKLANLNLGEGISGVSALMHRKSYFHDDAESFLFLRNKKGLLNINIGIPEVTSVDLLMQIKRELAVAGISRKGSLKMYLEISFPENILNLENYILAGIDGVILNLDSLTRHIFGMDFKRYKITHDQKISFLKFIEDGLKVLNKSKIPALAMGRLVEDMDVLRYFVSQGISGVVIPSARSNYFHYDFPQVVKI